MVAPSLRGSTVDLCSVRFHQSFGGNIDNNCINFHQIVVFSLRGIVVNHNFYTRWSYFQRKPIILKYILKIC
jgi:hypothetical protein